MRLQSWMARVHQILLKITSETFAKLSFRDISIFYHLKSFNNNIFYRLLKLYVLAVSRSHTNNRGFFQNNSLKKILKFQNDTIPTLNHILTHTPNTIIIHFLKIINESLVTSSCLARNRYHYVRWIIAVFA